MNSSWRCHLLQNSDSAQRGNLKRSEQSIQPHIADHGVACFRLRLELETNITVFRLYDYGTWRATQWKWIHALNNAICTQPYPAHIPSDTGPHAAPGTAFCNIHQEDPEGGKFLHRGFCKASHVVCESPTSRTPSHTKGSSSRVFFLDLAELVPEDEQELQSMSPDFLWMAIYLTIRALHERGGRAVEA